MTDAAAWLSRFETLARMGNGVALAETFAPESYWRDYLPFGWTLQTREGRAAIADLASAKGPATDLRDLEFEGDPGDTEGFFRFNTVDGPGRGHVRLEKGRGFTLFTMLDGLSDAAPQNALAKADAPEVLIVGGGQCGLALGAQLANLGVAYLIVDKHPRVGGQWRSRYDSLLLHDPVWYDHLPFMPFPDDWPIYTPKDQMADWLETYATELGLHIWTDTALTAARFDAEVGTWRATVTHGGEEKTLRPRHIVVALGLSGFANVPRLPGQDTFAGPQMHSSQYRAGDGLSGKRVVVVGANNSAHDIAADLVANGAHPTLLQRSSSLVVRQDDYCTRLLGPLYSAEAVESGITTDRADILQASMPLRVLEHTHKSLWDGIRADRADYYRGLTEAGFTLDFAEDGTGLGMKYRRTASGYYIDVGAAEMVRDGRIGVASGAGIERLSERAVHLTSGETLHADAVVYATGYGNMVDWIAKFMGTAVAEAVGPCWGYGSGTRGDPGPWVGEQRNMWMPTGQEALWCTGGNLSQARFFSRLLGLQLARAVRRGGPPAEHTNPPD
ncbi:MAG: NAD(P)/FAD-dependent oxidoreductase [Pseudomonadota bacterium]